MRRVSIQELKSLIEAEIKNAVEDKKITTKQLPWYKGRSDNPVNWYRALNLAELFKRKIEK